MELDERDIRWDTFTASGRTMGIRGLHMPTGICEDIKEPRSPHRARELIMQKLRSRLETMNNG